MKDTEPRLPYGGDVKQANHEEEAWDSLRQADLSKESRARRDPASKAASANHSETFHPSLKYIAE